VKVEGEVSGLKRSGNGHLYFCLKDAEAQVDCVMFSREAQRLRFRLEEGMAVRCRGRLTIYEGRGKFQMTIAELEPTGAGALALAFEQLKKKLQAEGLFDAKRKRALPSLPRRIGIVTAVGRDPHRAVTQAQPAGAAGGRQAPRLAGSELPQGVGGSFQVQLRAHVRTPGSRSCRGAPGSRTPRRRRAPGR